MTRKDLLNKLGYSFPEKYAKRVIVCSDAHNEADDQFAIVHHLLTPCENILGIVASHYEYMAERIEDAAKRMGLSDGQKEAMREQRGIAPLRKSMELSFEEILRVLSLMEVEDVAVLHGCDEPIAASEGDCEGVDFIIAQAQKRELGRLWVCVQGTLTDVAAALKKAPDIADNVTVVWIGGGAYPNGGMEFNLLQDIDAANIVMKSGAEVWQIPQNAYTKVHISFTELMRRIYPCGEIGKYLVQNLFRYYEEIALGCNGDWTPHRDSWCLGDNPTVSVLAVDAPCYTMECAPQILPDCSYTPNPAGKQIRVYHSVHERFIIEDLIAKLECCFGYCKG